MNQKPQFKTGLMIAVIVIVVAVLWVAMSYNGLVGKDENLTKKWADVETQYQRRADLIPNLVAVVQEYTDYEGSLLTEITRARSAWTGAKTPTEQQEAATGMDSAIGRLIVVMENYPTLQASPQFTGLRDELSGTENRVAYARSEYNGAVQTYNVAVRRFPGNIIAGIFGFEKKTPFESAEGSENAPKVGDLFNK